MGAVENQPEPQWYTVRCLFRFPDEDPQSDECWYEERLTLWQAHSHAEAISLAEAEAAQYVELLGAGEYVGLSQTFWLFEPPGHGGEVFSLIRGSTLAPKDYMDRFFDTGREVQGRSPDE